MKLIKGSRAVRWIPRDWVMVRQTKQGKQGRKFGFVEFEGTKEERATAQRLGRPVPRHQAWVNMSSMTEHE